MKIYPLLMKSIIIASLMTSISILAEDTQSVLPESTENINDEAGCDIDLLPPPIPTAKGDVTYVSGGICTGGVSQLKSMAKQFKLEVVLVEKTEAYAKENYIADVNVKINDAENNVILDVVTEGPFLLVNLPNGRYQITGEYNGVVKTRKVKISSNKHERVVLLWPEQTVSE